MVLRRSKKAQSKESALLNSDGACEAFGYRLLTTFISKFKSQPKQRINVLGTHIIFCLIISVCSLLKTTLLRGFHLCVTNYIVLNKKMIYSMTKTLKNNPESCTFKLN